MMGEAAMMGVVFEATAAKIHAQLYPGKKKKTYGPQNNTMSLSRFKVKLQ